MFPFKKIILGGGAAKGVLHFGALQELSKHQELYFPDGVYGTSVGSIMATLIAFQFPLNDNVMNAFKKHLSSIDRFCPPLTFKDVMNIIPEKGIYNMDLYEKQICIVFDELGFDIRNKKISDAKMPLYIVASNISKGIPTFFTGDVLILEAIKCSSCILGVFKPQELYGQLYVDGDIFTPCFGKGYEDALQISLKVNRTEKITPETIESMSPLIFFRQIFNNSVTNFIENQKTDNTLELVYPGLFAETNLNDLDIQDINKFSSESMRSFLITKGFLKEFS
jgi:predicted patatin/cPLA2 family phospholipase